MNRIDYPEGLALLIAELKRLPGVGTRTAERLAVWLLSDRVAAAGLSDALGGLHDRVTECSRCGFFKSNDTGCPVCRGERRDPSIVCVIESATDVVALERSGCYGGHYHVLGGRLAPLDDVGPDELRLSELVERIDGEGFTEVILAFAADVEGEATANYIVRMLGGRPSVRVTRLAQGLPAGSGLEFADSLTLERALAGRQRVGRSD